MKTIQTAILPTEHQFVKLQKEHQMHLEAICVFIATGFFMDDDTYWKDQKCLSPGHIYHMDDNGFFVDKKPWFHWSYEPEDSSFEDTLEAYIQLMTSTIKSQIGDKDVILPLSGGLDSRSQALFLKDLDNEVHSYSYSFQGGYPEHKISKQIAEVCGFGFQSFTIQKGYLWDQISELSKINQCYSEFTHPRQMAVLKALKQYEGVFSLGHWGDVFFDRGAPEGTQQHDIVPLLFKKMVKKSGLELANQLWDTWALDGDFKSYLISRIETALSKIQIDHVSAKVRAFKTTQWAHRWTTTNLSIFKAAHPITLPFYDDQVCQFVCRTPETHLADRKLQLAHLKQHKTLASITWHENRPFNILNYHKNRSPYNLPFRVKSKLKRSVNAWLGNPFIQRNWELQFLGKDNEAELKRFILSDGFNELVPKAIVETALEKFKTEDAVAYSHALSMLLTLSVWNQNKNAF
ncbi:asparagine synthase-related protein [Psychroserpens sp. BH13MA-6]